MRRAIDEGRQAQRRTLNTEINERLTRSISGLAEEALLPNLPE